MVRREVANTEQTRMKAASTLQGGLAAQHARNQARERAKKLAAAECVQAAARGAATRQIVRNMDRGPVHFTTALRAVELSPPRPLGPARLSVAASPVLVGPTEAQQKKALMRLVERRVDQVRRWR